MRDLRRCPHRTVLGLEHRSIIVGIQSSLGGHPQRLSPVWKSPWAQPPFFQCGIWSRKLVKRSQWCSLGRAPMNRGVAIGAINWSCCAPKPDALWRLSSPLLKPLPGLLENSFPSTCSGGCAPSAQLVLASASSTPMNCSPQPSVSS